jgi:hypothetical protein
MQDTALAVIILTVQLGGCVAIVGGLAYMVGFRSLGGRLAGVGFIGMIVEFALVPYRFAVADAVAWVPVWIRIPLLVVAAVTVGFMILRVLIRLFFGRRVADSVTADLLTWTIKGAIRAAGLPHRLVMLVSRLFAHDAIP